MTDLLSHQQSLLTYLENEANKQGGVLSFADFMKIALYAPGLGYYSAGMTKIGKDGDFVTAPEISSLFSKCLANYCSGQPTILELGAGTGKMAADLLLHLKEKNQLPHRYFILEVSADLKERQQVLLQKTLPDYYEHIEWIASLDNFSFKGIILANEVIDAMPVHLFKISEQNEVLEGVVTKRDNDWVLDYQPPITPELSAAVLALALPKFYQSEILLTLSPWIASLAKCLEQGKMLFIDYGFLQHEYYHVSRNTGTLMCHHRHRAHADPMQNIGLQDITAHVDFTALELAAKKCGLKVEGFSNQASFLIHNGLLALTKHIDFNDIKTSVKVSQEIQVLTSPHEMGELFKVMAFSKGLR